MIVLNEFKYSFEKTLLGIFYSLGDGYKTYTDTITNFIIKMATKQNPNEAHMTRFQQF